jgi:moderate conductance mechanosensitive channel
MKPFSNLLRVKLFYRFAIGTLVALVVVFGPVIAPSALAQLPSLVSPTQGQNPPLGVERRGGLEAAAVRLDGVELFKIAAPTVFNRSEPGPQIPVEVRASQVEANLECLLEDKEWPDEGRLDPATMQVFVETLGGQPVLFVRDATLAEARAVLTVTGADAQFYGIGKDQLANRWQDILQRDLRQALELRQPEALQQQTLTVAKIVALAGLLTLVLGSLRVFLGWRKRQLEQRQLTQAAAAQPDDVHDLVDAKTPERSLRWPGLLHYFDLQRRLQLVQFLQWLLFWAIASVWLTALAYSLRFFPQTRQFSGRIITIPIIVLVAWFVTGLINRLTDMAIDRFIHNHEQDHSLTEANLQRIDTITKVTKGLKTAVLYTASFLWVLQVLELAPESILIVGALLALAASFAAQTLVKDLVNGFLILFEDQFRIGDYIKTNAAAGLVENVNLRITQIRSDAGNLITLPNSQIIQVGNMSRTWARADFKIAVAYDTDVDLALAIVRDTLNCMTEDPAWSSIILDTQELFGVERLSHTGIVIRVWIKTAPLKQWMTARELRRRLKVAFDVNDIHIGTPQHILLNQPTGIP